MHYNIRIKLISNLLPKNMKEKIFKQDAKQIVDLAFDKKLFKDEVTRDNMNAFEELIDFLLSSRYESYKRAEKLFESSKKTKNQGG